MILIGSEALAYYKEGVIQQDLDLVGTYEEANIYRKGITGVRAFYPINSGKSLYISIAGKIIEVEVAWEGSRAAKFLAFAERHPEEFTTIDGGFLLPSLDVLYLLKMSHRYLKDSPHFLKTMRDIQWMRQAGARIKDEHHPFYLQRMADTYSYAHPKLNVPKDGFFDPQGTGVAYTHDHDSIHEAVAVGDRPAYTYFKPEDSEVMCDKGMFFAADRTIQLRAVLEESYVLALERSLIPYTNGKTPKEAFDMALMKVCTSITSGWFREFAWENYDAVQALYNEDFVEKFKAGLESGIVQPFKSSVY